MSTSKMDSLLPQTLHVTLEPSTTHHVLSAHAGSPHMYCCDTFDEFLDELHSETLVKECTIGQPRKKRLLRRISSSRGTHLHAPAKALYVVKIKHIDTHCTTEMALGDLERSKELHSLMQQSELLQDLVVAHRDVVPGHVTVMERCMTDAWKSKHIRGERSVLRYFAFGLSACGELARHGFEARDYKAANVGCRRLAEKSPYCIIDTSQIMRIDQADTAVCTYPACGAWTHGHPDSLVGLAATAWSVVADLYAMAGHDAEAISHMKIFQSPSSTPLNTYCAPTKLQDMRLWIATSGLQETCPHVALVLGRALSIYTAAFEEGRQVNTVAEAQRDAYGFYRELTVIVELVLRQCVDDKPYFL